jgi:hypothetical protein
MWPRHEVEARATLILYVEQESHDPKNVLQPVCNLFQKLLNKKIITHVGQTIIWCVIFPIVIASEHLRFREEEPNRYQPPLVMVDDILDVPDAPSDSPPALTASDNRDNVITDPPPPYPLPRRQRTGRSRRGRLRTQHLLHGQMASADSYSDPDTLTSAQSNARTFEDDEEVHATETTPFLSPSDSPTSTSHQVGGRPRSYSHGSTMSAAPSLARTVLSLFVTEDGSLFGDEVHLSSVSHPDGHLVSEHTRRDNGFSWKAYFRPVRRAVYWRSLLHLALLNFPFALAAWVYLFVFTVVSHSLRLHLHLTLEDKYPLYLRWHPFLPSLTSLSSL